MNKSVAGAGYTIVETLIFLAVSATMFISAVALISGQQSKTEFQQGIRDVQSQLDQVINNIATGYYPYTSQNIKCTGGPVGPVIVPSGTNTQGSNAGCTFIGHVIHFGVGGNKTQVNDYTVAGNQFISGNATTVADLSDAQPVVVANSTQTINLPYGITVEKVTSGASTYGALGFIASFVPYNSGVGVGNLVSGAQTIDLIPIAGTAVGDSTISVTNQISNAPRANFNKNTAKNPTGGLQVCFKSGSTNQHAIITIGVQGRANTNLTIYSGNTCP